MIDIIPLPIYTSIFDYLIFFLIIIASIQGFSGTIFKKEIIQANMLWGIILIIFVIFYMGLRPISGRYFGDTSNYAVQFYKMATNNYILSDKEKSEWIFTQTMLYFSKYTTINIFYLFCAFIYLGSYWWAMKRFFGNYYYIPLLMIMSLFIFWNGGVNGIRTGLALSLLILAFSFYKNWKIIILLCFLAIGIHQSSLLIILSAGVAWIITNPKYYLWTWFACIGLSSTLGNQMTSLMTKLNITDERFDSYLTSTEFSEQFSSLGFRWDFLIFSALPVIIGWYFIFRKNYKDNIYIWLFNIYLLSNSFWVLVIRAEFSNRFASLSWTIMPLVFIYPFFKHAFWVDQEKKIGWAIIVFYSFTFYYNILH